MTLMVKPLIDRAEVPLILEEADTHQEVDPDLIDLIPTTPRKGQNPLINLREIALGRMISAIFAARKAIGPETVGVRVKPPTPNHPIRVDNEVGQTLEILVDMTAVALARQSTLENMNPPNHPLQERRWNSGVLEGGSRGPRFFSRRGISTWRGIF